MLPFAAKSESVICHVWAVLLFGWSFNLSAQTVQLHWTSPVKDRVVTFYAEPRNQAPQLMGILVQPQTAEIESRKRIQEWEAEIRTNRNLIRTKPFPMDTGMQEPDFSKAVWMPFKTNVTVDFGPGDGPRWLWFSFKDRGDPNPQWESCDIFVQTSAPFICITNPVEPLTHQPLIQLQGYSSCDLKSIHYELFNQNRSVTAQGEGVVNDRYFDSALFEFTTNVFTCYDINLSPGTNRLMLNIIDNAGHSVVTNLIYVFTTVGDTNPPVFKLDSPVDGSLLSGSSFGLHGPCNDPTAQVTAFICDEQGNATKLDGYTERNGYLWVDNIPLHPGISYITVVTTDAATNSSVTNITVGKSRDVLYMDPVADPNQLWQPKITISGYYSRTNPVSVNGVKAMMKPDGHWIAENVPVVSPNGGGTATFDMTSDYDEKMLPSHIWRPADLSCPTNGLQAALSIGQIGTNEYNHYPFFLGITNSSGTNQPRNWVLPVSEERFSLRLLGKDGRAISQNQFIQKSGQNLAGNLNLRHLGNDALAHIDGIIPLTTNMAMQLSTFNLDEYFQLPPPGDYRLEAVERLYEANRDGKLTPFALQPVAAEIKVISQPSEIMFFLRDLERQKKLYWSPPSNKMRVAVVHRTDIARGSLLAFDVFLENLGTNDIHNLRVPRVQEQFDISLYDASGNEVARTPLGKQRGLPLTDNNPSSTELFPRPWPVFVPAGDAQEIDQFDLNELFEIKSPGKYRLTYQQRFLWSDQVQKWTGLVMPMVVVPLDISLIPPLPYNNQMNNPMF